MTHFLPSSLPLVSFSVACLALSACFPQHVDPRGNGDSGALDFNIQNEGGNRVILATGFQAEIGITRTDGQWQNCIISKNVAAPVTSVPTPNAGTLSPKDSCSSLNTEPIQLIDASCDDNACIVTPENLGGGIVALLITGTRDGDTKLHVNVKSTGSSSTWGDSYPLTFATPVDVAIDQHSTEINQPGFAFLPGASFDWCPSLQDANGNVLTEIPSSITSAIGGAAGVSVTPPEKYAPETNCVAFSASSAGTSSITFTAQSLTATASLVVADPKDIVGAELRAFLSPTESVDGGVGKDASADAGDGSSFTLATSPTTSINLTTDDYFGNDYASVLTLKDGTHALGGAGLYRSSYDTALSVQTSDSDPELARTTLSFDVLGGIIGDGTVSATINGITVSIPFHITEGPSHSDGGAR